MSYYDASIFLSDAKLKGGASNDKYVGTYNNGVYYNSGYYLVESDTAITNGRKDRHEVCRSNRFRLHRIDESSGTGERFPQGLEKCRWLFESGRSV